MQTQKLEGTDGKVIHFFNFSPSINLNAKKFAAKALRQHFLSIKTPTQFLTFVVEQFVLFIC